MVKLSKEPRPHHFIVPHPIAALARKLPWTSSITWSQVVDISTVAGADADGTPISTAF